MPDVLVRSTQSGLAWSLAVAAAVVVGLGARGEAAAAAVALTAFVTAFLADVDVRTHRLPNVVVLPLTLAVLLVLTVVAAVTEAWASLLGAVIGSLALSGCYLVLALIRAGGMGGGDVKLALALGLTGGWFGLHAWIWVMFAPFVIGGVLAVIGLTLRRLTWTAALPFGPAMALGYVIAAVVAF